MQEIEQNIRNVTIIGQKESGKSALINLICSSFNQSILPPQEYNISSIALLRDNIHYNFIDTPSFSDSKAEIAACLTLSDGIIYIVDLSAFQQKNPFNISKLAFQIQSQTIYFLNKIQILIISLKYDEQQILKYLINVCAKIDLNNNFEEDNEQKTKDINWNKFIFGSVKDEWAFTLNNSLQYDNQNYEILKTIIRNLCLIYKSAQIFDKQALRSIVLNLNIDLEEKVKPILQQKNEILQKWIPLCDCLFKIIYDKISSPQKHQFLHPSKYYETQKQQNIIKAIKDCNSLGPLIIKICKIIQDQNKQLLVLGRILSGTINLKQKIIITGQDFQRKFTNKIYQQQINKLAVMIGNRAQLTEKIGSGRIIAIGGIDRFISHRGATILDATYKFDRQFFLKPLKYFNYKIFKGYIRPKNAIDLPKMIAGLKIIQKLYLSVDCECQETGENIIFADSLHLIQIMIQKLERDYARCEIDRYQIMSAYRQTIREQSKIIMVKSQNKHNRLYGNSSIIDSKLIQILQNGQLYQIQYKQYKNKKIKSNYKFQQNFNLSKIWSIGPYPQNSNLLVNKMIGLYNWQQQQIKSSVISAFNWNSSRGIICDQPMRGIQFNLTDAECRIDAIHRGGGQIIPATRRLMYGIQLHSKPTLMFPNLICKIVTSFKQVKQLYDILHLFECKIVSQNHLAEILLSYIVIIISASQLIRLQNQLKQIDIRRYRIIDCSYYNWQLIDDLLYENMVNVIRSKKGLSLNLPLPQFFSDRL